MSHPARNVRCSHTTAAGNPCRAWALQGTDPPACWAHSGRSSPSEPVGRQGRAGAPRGNQNARTHGFYATVLDADELAELQHHVTNLSLDGEIACARFALRRVLNYLNAHTAGPPGGPAAGDLPREEGVNLSPADYSRLVNLSLQAVRTIARLVRDQQASPAATLGLLPHELADDLDERKRAVHRQG